MPDDRGQEIQITVAPKESATKPKKEETPPTQEKIDDALKKAEIVAAEARAKLPPRRIEEMRINPRHLEDADLIELVEQLKNIKGLLKRAAYLQDNPRAQELLRLYNRAESESHRRFQDTERAVQKQEAGLQMQVMAQYVRIFHKDAQIDMVQGKGVHVERGEQGNITTISIPPQPDVNDFLTLARELDPGSFREGSGRRDNLMQYTQDLMTTALLMEREGVFTEDAILMVYNTGYQLQQKLEHPEQLTQKATRETLKKESEQVSFETLDEQTQERIFLDIFLGRNAREQRIQLPGSQKVVSQESFYHRLHDRWQREHQNEPIEDYNNWLLANRGRLTTILSRFVTSDTVAAKLQNQEIDLMDQEESDDIFSRQITHWVGTIQTATKGGERDFQKIVDSARATMKSGSKNEQDYYILGALTSAMQNPTSEQLVHIPAEARRFFTGEDQFSDAGCAVKAAVLYRVLQEQNFIVIPHQEGTHMYLIVTINGKRYRVDPSTPSDSGIPAVLDYVGPQEAPTQDGDSIIISAFLQNMVAGNMLQTEGLTRPQQQELRIAVLHEAIKRNEENVLAWIELAQQYERNSEEYQTCISQARSIDPELVQRLEQTDSRERIVANWNLDPALRAAIGALADPRARQFLAEIDDDLDQLDAIRVIENGGTPIPPGHETRLEDLVELDLGQGGERVKKFQERIDQLRQIPGALPPNIAAQLSVLFNRATREAHLALQERRGNQYFRLTPADEQEIREDRHAWLEKRFRILTSSWTDGAMPSGPNYQAYSSKMEEASSFVETLVGPGGSLTEEDAGEFRELQAVVQHLMVAATETQQGGGGHALEHYKRAQEAVQNTQYEGMWMLERFIGGGVGDLMHMYNLHLRRRYVEDGKWLKAGSRKDIERMIVGDVVEDAITRYTSRSTAGAPFGDDILGQYAERYQSIVNEEIKKNKDRYRGLTNAQAQLQAKALFADEFRVQLNRMVKSHMTMARWASIAWLSEGAISAKGLPPPKGSGNEDYPDADFAGYNFPWLTGLPTAFRFDLMNAANRRFFYGLTNDPGPWRRHIVSMALEDTGVVAWDPSRLTEEEFLMADKAMFWFEYYYQSDRLYDSVWRMGTYMKHLRNGLVKRFNDGHLPPHPDRASLTDEQYSNMFALGIQLRLALHAGKPDIAKRESLWRGAIATYMPDKALEVIRENFDKGRTVLTPAEESFNNFLTSPAATFLDGIAAKKSLVQGDRTLAQFRYDVFSRYLSPLMLQLRRDSYRGSPPQQLNFGTGARSAEIAEYFDAMGIVDASGAVIPGATIAAQFATLMHQMSGVVSSDAIAGTLSHHVRYINVYYRTPWEEDSLMDEQYHDATGHERYYHEGFRDWLEGETGNGVFRHYADLINQTQGADALMSKVVSGDMNNPEEILKATLEVAGFIAAVKGASGRGLLELKYGAFYLNAIHLKNVFGFLGIDARSANASLAKEYFGEHVIGRTDQEILQLFEKFLKNAVQLTSPDKATAAALEKKMRELMYIAKDQLRNKTIMRWLVLVLGLVIKNYATKEIPSVVLAK